MGLRALPACAWPWAITFAAAILWLILPASVRAQAGSGAGGGLGGLPPMTIAPAEGEAPEQTPAPIVTKHHRVAPPPAVHHAAAPGAFVVPEPAQARLLLKEDALIYAEPSNASAQVEKGQKGKFVMVTGTTHYFLRVKLKNGEDGYVLADAVAIDTPADKIFMLTRDTPVLNAPNHWSRKVAEVHQGHAVHVVGIALSYMKIRMKSGLEGYIPASALE
jgi:hypothetical protein